MRSKGVIMTLMATPPTMLARKDSRMGESETAS